ncbi:MAG: BTB/POZ domain-containing protein, partial [Sphingomonadales bacterium]|nr:BTB/POZ domain-containing protein [Sphingomonadales bacterium]
KTYRHNFHSSSREEEFRPTCEVLIRLTISKDSDGPIAKRTHDIRQLYNDGDFSDVEVHSGNVVIKAHKNILSAHSATLQAAFRSDNFTEGKTGVYTIKESDMEPGILKDVIKWMYMYDIEDADNKVESLLAAADYFQMAALSDFCCTMLSNRMCPGNCLAVLATACKYNFKSLKRLASDMLIHNRKSVIKATQDLASVVSNIPQEVQNLLGIEPEGKGAS